MASRLVVLPQYLGELRNGASRCLGDTLSRRSLRATPDGRATHPEPSVMMAGLVSVTSSNRFLKYVGSQAWDLRHHPVRELRTDWQVQSGRIG